MRLIFARKATQYIFFEMLPSFILGLFVFVFILLMFQALRLTEFVLVHGVSIKTVLEIALYLTVSFLPALFPMSLLFSVLMTYGRMSADSEIVAFKASGLSMISLAIPAIMLGLLVAFISAKTSFHVAPWGNRKFEVIINKLSQTKASASLKEGTFSEGFFDLVIYANAVDTKTGNLSKVFIYDERDTASPLTIIAKKGLISQGQDQTGQEAKLTLFQGDVHKKSETHTKIKFNTLDIHLFDPATTQEKDKSPQSFTIEEVQDFLKNPKLPEAEIRTFQTEFHKRWAVTVLCIVFAFLGVGLGTETNRRNQKNNGLVLSLLTVISYWVIYVTAEGLARSGNAPIALAIWLPNILFFVIAVRLFRKQWN